jgi:hypothetical protein
MVCNVSFRGIDASLEITISLRQTSGVKPRQAVEKVLNHPFLSSLLVALFTGWPVQRPYGA